MDTLGMWLRAHGEAVYGTRGGPYKPFEGGFSTRRGQRAWLLVTDPLVRTLELPQTEQRMISARDELSGRKVEFTVADGTVCFELPEAVLDEPVRVVRLKFAEPVEMCDR